jgi:hypothetical protein
VFLFNLCNLECHRLPRRISLATHIKVELPAQTRYTRGANYIATSVLEAYVVEE